MGESNVGRLVATSVQLLQTFVCPPVPVCRQVKSTSRGRARGEDVDGTLEIGSGKYWRAECAAESYESSVQTEKVGTAVSKVWRACSFLQRKETGEFTSSVGDKNHCLLRFRPSVSMPPLPYHQLAASGSPAGRAPARACARVGGGARPINRLCNRPDPTQLWQRPASHPTWSSPPRGRPLEPFLAS